MEVPPTNPAGLPVLPEMQPGVHRDAAEVAPVTLATATGLPEPLAAPSSAPAPAQHSTAVQTETPQPAPAPTSHTPDNPPDDKLAGSNDWRDPHYPDYILRSSPIVITTILVPEDGHPAGRLVHMTTHVQGEPGDAPPTLVTKRLPSIRSSDLAALLTETVQKLLMANWQRAKERAERAEMVRQKATTTTTTTTTISAKAATKKGGKSSGTMPVESTQPIQPSHSMQASQTIAPATPRQPSLFDQPPVLAVPATEVEAAGSAETVTPVPPVVPVAPDEEVQEEKQANGK